MEPLISEYKQKLLSVVVASAVSFLGFEALSIILSQTYQVKTYMWVAFYVYIFHVIWLLFLFDLHLKQRGVLVSIQNTHQGLAMLGKALHLRVSHMLRWHYLRHYLNFLILPGIIYWSAVVLVAINPFASELKQFIIIGSTLGLSVAYWYLKEVFSKNFELHHFGTRILALVKILTAFLFYAAAIGYTFYFGLSAMFLFCTVLVGTFFLIYQALFQRKLVSFSAHAVVIVISLILAVISYWIFQTWSHNYLTAALVLVAVYNTAWGLLHHHLDNNLSRKLIFEYIMLLILTISIVLASHDFAPRI
jgi:hypothetical protein